MKVTTDTGEVGWGECSLPAKPHALLGALKDLEQLLVGADPLHTEWCWQRMHRHGYWRGGGIQTAAMSGVDIALWDIRSRRLGLPLHEALGGPVRDRIRLYANCGLSTDPDELRRRVRAAVDLGYTAVKFYPLHAFDAVLGPAVISNIVECCEAVRDEIGEDRDFSVDFHGRLTAGAAVGVEAAIRHTRPLWIEEPVLPENVGALRRLAEKFEIPIALGERLFTRWDFRQVLENEFATVLQPDVANAGGVTEMMKIAALAEMYGMGFAPHNPSGPVHSMTSIHLAAAAQAFKILEHRHQYHDFMNGLIGAEVPVVEADGCLPLPSTPGIGVSIDEGFARAHSEGEWIPEAFRGDGTIIDW